MFGHPSFKVEPWRVVEDRLDLDMLAQTESVFALSNGHIGMRGNLDEGEPFGLPGTYLNSVYELRPLPYAEAGYGDPESGQTVVNVTNGKVIRLLVDDEPFDVRYGKVLSHWRALDLRAGVLQREVEWCSPADSRVKVRSTRMVSLVQRAAAAVRFEVEAGHRPVRVVVQSELVANEQLPPASGDPRVAAVLANPLVPEENLAAETGGLLVHTVRRSGLRVGAGMDHKVEAPVDVDVSSEAAEDVARVTFVARLDPGQTLAVTKFLAYGWSAQRSRPAVHDQVRGALKAASLTGWDGLLAEQRSWLEQFWECCDVEISGDPEIQQAVRFAMFQVMQAGVRAEKRPIPAKGLTGTGYDGHAFWDTEIFVLRFLDHAIPEAVADALEWRQSTLPAARDRARQLGLKGATFPWRTINGQESSSYWPAGTAAFHVNADVAYAVTRHVAVTGDVEFERDVGLELLVETARLWHSLGHHGPEGKFRIDGVTGPDEYSAVADNNVFTNLMAQQNLGAAADAVGRHPQRARDLGVDDEEAAAWRDAATAMTIPYDPRFGVHPQAEGFTDHQPWDFAATRPDQYPLLNHFPYFDLYRKQVVKQADLVLAMHLLGSAFRDDDKARNFDYYERLTVRDSSLSASTQSVVAVETGHPDLAYDYLGEAALIDLADLEHNTRDGIHIASLAGTWTALVEGLGGMRTIGSALVFRPRLPDAISRLRFRVNYRDRLLGVSIDKDSAEYELFKGDTITFSHYDRQVTLEPGKPVTEVVPPLIRRARPSQPAGREPADRVDARHHPVTRRLPPSVLGAARGGGGR